MEEYIIDLWITEQEGGFKRSAKIGALIGAGVNMYAKHEENQGSGESGGYIGSGLKGAAAGAGIGVLLKARKSYKTNKLRELVKKIQKGKIPKSIKEK
jgi:hypothetical protein